MLEEEIEADTVKSLRQRMMDKTVGYIPSFHLSWRCSHLYDASQIYVKNRHEILLDDTAAGLHEGRWEWLDTP